MEHLSLILYFDGASRGNPGPAGAGVYTITDPPSDINIAKAKYLGKKTNNEAEYEALILGLKAVLKLLKEGHSFASLNIKGDSKLVVMQLGGSWRVRKRHLIPLHGNAEQLIEQIGNFGVNHRIEHISRNLNHEADKLANQAIDQHFK